jgi:hypothetical protein
LTVEIALIAFLVLKFIVPMMERKEHPLLNFLLLALCIAALFQVFILRGSVTQRFQLWLDRKFFREAYNSEVLLSELSEQVRRLTDKDALFEIILQRISESSACIANFHFAARQQRIPSSASVGDRSWEPARPARGFGNHPEPGPNQSACNRLPRPSGRMV